MYINIIINVWIRFICYTSNKIFNYLHFDNLNQRFDILADLIDFIIVFFKDKVSRYKGSIHVLLKHFMSILIYLLNVMLNCSFIFVSCESWYLKRAFQVTYVTTKRLLYYIYSCEMNSQLGDSNQSKVLLQYSVP